MIEDLIILIVVVAALVAVVASSQTREHLKNKKKKKGTKLPELSPQDSLNSIVSSLEKVGPAGTYKAFDTQLKTYEDIISHENDTE
jgi:cell division protein YceG involved in septum cleavage